MAVMRWHIGFIALACSLVSAQAAAQGYISRTLHHPVPGGVAVIPLGAGPTAPRILYKDRRVMVVRDTDQQWIAVVGIDLTTTPGKQHVSMDVGTGRSQVDFTVGNKTYAVQRITLKNKSHVNPDPDQLRRYQRERKEQDEAYAHFSDGGPSNILLDAPVKGRLSSPFGLRRFFNGQERNAHSGLDFAVSSGTPIKAPADGVVTIVADYFFNGKTVFLDHGQGLVTMYCHLSAAQVKLGEKVSRGQVVANVGSTGRATGPHLHWNVSLNNTRVDPAIFIKAFKP